MTAHRIGVFYDGTWFAHVSDFYATEHLRQARISFGGLHDAFRQYVHVCTGADLDNCVMTEAHYIRGRSTTPSTVFDNVLDNAGITRHDVELADGREKGADVYLALEVWERATTTPLEFVVLITGDADFVPLVTRLISRGVRVVVPVINAVADRPTSGPSTLRTAPQLASATKDHPTFDELFLASEHDDYPLRYPFVRNPSSAAAPSTNPAGRWRGTVTGWRQGQTSGFITDNRGGSWFVSRDELPDGYDNLDVGTPVSFTGSPKPAPGKKYPQAYSIHID
ncbi:MULTISPECIES: NYN domain-containing protein [Amycolatopsis]|uniref:NYN domain-containing protein n=1 Tax=Amycolatopsis saalfeldensis TaxID=394193 RepID=A0A1H8YPZ8_9PSEU|nr:MULTISPECIES: NYN domain-containing protein [Amycolatopsis]SEP54295.1 NYN domain-containing protein [Amycolatopsis saalfeldensis]